jgi:hypothetical protein
MVCLLQPVAGHWSLAASSARLPETRNQQPETAYSRSLTVEIVSVLSARQAHDLLRALPLVAMPASNVQKPKPKAGN